MGGGVELQAEMSKCVERVIVEVQPWNYFICYRKGNNYAYAFVAGYSYLETLL